MLNHLLIISAAVILVARIKATKVFMVRVAFALVITLTNPRCRKRVTKITTKLA